MMELCDSVNVWQWECICPNLELLWIIAACLIWLRYITVQMMFSLFYWMNDLLAPSSTCTLTEWNMACACAQVDVPDPGGARTCDWYGMIWILYDLLWFCYDCIRALNFLRIKCITVNYSCCITVVVTPWLVLPGSSHSLQLCFEGFWKKHRTTRKCHEWVDGWPVAWAQKP